MDGYAVRFTDTMAATGSAPLRSLLGDKTLEINRDEPVPPGFDAVIAIEEVNQVSADEVEITAPATPWQHVRTLGQDMIASELILPADHLIKPADAAALQAGGIAKLQVRRLPAVAMIHLGSGSGALSDMALGIAAGMAEELGAEVFRREIVADDFAHLLSEMRHAVKDCDLALFSAGSAGASAVQILQLMNELGEVLVDKVRIDPGGGVILGSADGRPLVYMPEDPASAALLVELFVKPLIVRMQGLKPFPGPTVSAAVPIEITSPHGVDSFIRVKLGKAGKRLIAVPIERTAGSLLTLVQADGILHVPEEIEKILPGEETAIEIHGNLEEVTTAVVIVGSRDMVLDILVSDFGKKHPGKMLSASRTGSMEGLMTLARGEAHMACVSLLDTEAGAYNSVHVRKYLPNRKITLINLVFKELGLIVKKGNPKDILSLEDLTREDVSFINQTGGSRIRTLLDYRLRLRGIAAGTIRGFEREEDSEMAAAAAVFDGIADAGMGTAAAAAALGLDFVPFASERIDLAIPSEFIEEPTVESVVGILRSAEFRNKIAALSGYDSSRSGEIVGQT